jgi:hypothetical protein
VRTSLKESEIYSRVGVFRKLKCGGWKTERKRSLEREIGFLYIFFFVGSRIDESEAIFL